MKLRLRMPEARRDGVNLFYARDGQGPEWQWHEGTIEVPVRELDVYDVIVVQQLEEWSVRGPGKGEWSAVLQA